MRCAGLAALAPRPPASVRRRARQPAARFPRVMRQIPSADRGRLLEAVRTPVLGRTPYVGPYHDRRPRRSAAFAGNPSKEGKDSEAFGVLIPANARGLDRL